MRVGSLRTNFFSWIFALLALSLSCSVGTSYAQRHKRHSKKKTSHVSSVTKLHRERSKKEDELGALRQEIAKYSKELKQHEAQASRSKRNIVAYNRRTKQLEQLIDALEARVAALSVHEAHVTDSLQTATNTLDRLKSSYAAGVRYLYTHGAMETRSADELLLGGGSNGAAIRESYYAMLVGQAHAMNRAKLDSTRAILGSTQRSLHSAITKEAQAIDQTSDEAETLEAKRDQEASHLHDIESKKQRIQIILKQKQQSAKRLEGMIANLIERETKAAEARRKAEARKRATSHRSHSHASSSASKAGPHSLRWPTSTHRVLEGYGEHTNESLGTVTMNLGINIGTSSGSAVYAAADGSVSLISALPGYGTIVVLQHDGGLHTVYADLSSVSVHVGATVRAGQVIARSGRNPEGTAVLHFEVWRGRSRQNPMRWLR